MYTIQLVLVTIYIETSAQTDLPIARENDSSNSPLKEHNLFIDDLYFLEINQNQIKANATKKVINMSNEVFSEPTNNRNRKKNKFHRKNNKKVQYFDEPIAKKEILNNKGILLDIFYSDLKENQVKYLIIIAASCLTLILITIVAFLAFKLCYTNQIRQKMFYKLMLSNEKNTKNIGGGGI